MELPAASGWTEQKSGWEVRPERQGETCAGGPRCRLRVRLPEGRQGSHGRLEARGRRGPAAVGWILAPGVAQAVCPSGHPEPPGWSHALGDRQCYVTKTTRKWCFGSILQTPRSTEEGRAVLSLEHPARVMLHALMSCYGPDQEEVTGRTPAFDTGDKLALPAPCILLTVLGFSVEFKVHLIGPEHMCTGSFA